MAKRSATNQLNHENWDDDDESEPAGTFVPLVGDELKNRIIKKARRSLGKKEGTSPASSPFAAFSGFTSSSSTVSPFSFLKKSNDKEESNTKLNIIPQSISKKENGSNFANSEEIKSVVGENSVKSLPDSSRKQKPYRSIDYYRHLQSLNESVLNWMQLHLSKNKCCDFTPVFNDYRKHLDTLNVTYPVKQKDIEDEVIEKSPTIENIADAEKSSNANHEFKFGNSVKKDDETDYGAHFSSSTTNTSTFSFGLKKTPSATSSLSTGVSTTSFKEELVPEKKPFQFSFGLKNTQDLSKSFNFASTPVDKTGDSESNVEEEYIPPKNDFIAVKEEDAFYSKRCKLFFKKDDGFVDKGVGILHLKPLDGKTQLLIRADTSLGNILLNIVLSASLPMSRTGKNNVLLVCVPNPPLEVKNDNEDSKEASAIPMLIRVKTTEDADELLETLNKHKS